MLICYVQKKINLTSGAGKSGLFSSVNKDFASCLLAKSFCCFLATYDIFLLRALFVCGMYVVWACGLYVGNFSYALENNFKNKFHEKDTKKRVVKKRCNDKKEKSPYYAWSLQKQFRFFSNSY